MNRPIAAILLSVVGSCVLADNATSPGQVTTPHPTIIHLAIEWQIEGDDNLNGVVTVRFRPAGDEKWRDGLPLRRVPAGKSRGTNPIFEWKNKHSGSLFDLKPGTEYEIALKLDDPDGGKAERTVRASTRPVPRVPKDAPVKKCTPEALAPALDAAQPGDVLLLTAGSYGDLTVGKDGTAQKPLVLRAEPGAAFARISLRDRKHVFVEGATVNGSIDLLGAESCVVRRCTVTVKGKSFGIGATRPPGAKNCYIADNVVTGSTPWTSEAMGASGKNEGEGIQITGPGNVICYNRVSAFRDCISTMEDRGTGEQVCIDIYNNDITVGADDGIEADFCMHNCRIVRNRMTSCFVGLSSQPGLGGPTYFIRNVMYGLTYAPFKLHRYSQGDVCLHNTVVKVGDGMCCFASQPFDFAFFRNNLCIGGPPGAQRWGGYGGGAGAAARMVSPGPHCSFDYDALGTHKTPFQGQFGAQRFASLDDLHKGPHETHAIQVDMSVFAGVEFPDPPVPVRQPPDLRPRLGSAVVDKGVRLPNINDDFAGAAPDLGACEATQPLPHYGPRPPQADPASE
ncbi:MAG TPA: right-handed parallel beta-helix repeat-containing protein [Planctomycetota bacterium]|nr:right-handed parallel beta-helix repeat-containing protein [Planctomycetota bacterium]